MDNGLIVYTLVIKSIVNDVLSSKLYMNRFHIGIEAKKIKKNVFYVRYFHVAFFSQKNGFLSKKQNEKNGLASLAVALAGETFHKSA